MKILITGGCGFVGSNIAIYLKKKLKKAKISSLDNLTRKGSILNRDRLKIHRIKNFNFNIEKFEKIRDLPKFIAPPNPFFVLFKTLKLLFPNIKFSIFFRVSSSLKSFIIKTS